MGIYSHQTTEQLTALRTTLQASLTDRLTKPTAAGSGDRNARFDQQVAEIRKELGAVCAELDRRNGVVEHRPIYLV
ncbi:hypothetical protein [Pseudazoarcus pumilus]|uniref:Uncharacterized protein n=1 Tax=Pseudazoarcus pumilus TaxID=2067960 RepID=A0A2I6S846_9RHOO|nr:hypothetical protein [Pseudazoarcus pumilus]AUN95412.1 hypothetical protein C0099_11025 [Pseudazoarcus pumilus]